MNKPLSPATIATLATFTSAEMETIFGTAKPASKRHGKPFAKRREGDGQARRTARKAKTANRFAWMD